MGSADKVAELHLERLRRGDTGRGSSSRACFERVVRRGALPRGGPFLLASPAPSSITHVPSPFVLISTLVVAGTSFAKGFDTVQQSAPSEALLNRQDIA